MGLFDEIVGGLEAKEAQQAGLFGEVASLVTQAGGVNGLAQQFQQKGLEGAIAGCIGGGTNPPITADQIIQVLGQDRITAIASRVGLSEPQVAEGISKLLPLVVNHLTASGTAPDPAAGELEGALGALKSKLFNS